MISLKESISFFSVKPFPKKKAWQQTAGRNCINAQQLRQRLSPSGVACWFPMRTATSGRSSAHLGVDMGDTPTPMVRCEFGEKNHSLDQWLFLVPLKGGR